MMCISKNDIIKHYDSLIDENNDPVHDPKPLRDYMDKWDGQGFIDKMGLTLTEHYETEFAHIFAAKKEYRCYCSRDF